MTFLSNLNHLAVLLRPLDLRGMFASKKMQQELWNQPTNILEGLTFL